MLQRGNFVVFRLCVPFPTHALSARSKQLPMVKYLWPLFLHARFQIHGHGKHLKRLGMIWSCPLLSGFQNRPRRVLLRVKRFLCSCSILFSSAATFFGFLGCNLVPGLSGEDRCPDQLWFLKSTCFCSCVLKGPCSNVSIVIRIVVLCSLASNTNDLAPLEVVRTARRGLLCQRETLVSLPLGIGIAGCVQE